MALGAVANDGRRLPVPRPETEGLQRGDLVPETGCVCAEPSTLTVPETATVPDTGWVTPDPSTGTRVARS